MRLPVWLPFVVVVAVALALGFPPEQHPAHPINLFPDSSTYLNWTIGRPPTPWLFYALVGDGAAVRVAHTLLSLLCWTAFGWFALGLPGAIVAAALGLSLPVALWNYTVLSEPLTLSLGAALCAATLALGQRWSRARFAAWAACVLLFSCVRVENFLIVPLFCAALLLWHRRRWLAIGAVGSVAAALFLLFGVLLDRQSTNWQNRLTNVVLTRILRDPALSHQFHVNGMPREPMMLAHTGRMLMYYSPEFRAQTPAFQRWLDGPSRSTYIRWLATLQPHRMLIADMDRATARLTNGYYMGGTQYPRAATALIALYDALAIPFRFWWLLGLVPVSCAALTRSVRFADVFALIYLAAVYAMSFVVFHADTGELDRHMTLAAALYRMAPLVALACIWQRIGWRPAGSRTPETRGTVATA